MEETPSRGKKNKRIDQLKSAIDLALDRIKEIEFELNELAQEIISKCEVSDD